MVVMLMEVALLWNFPKGLQEEETVVSMTTAVVVTMVALVIFGRIASPLGSGRCFNCGLDGHWAQDCKADDWKNKCYRFGERGHKVVGGRSYSRTPSPPRHARIQSPSRIHNYSRSKTPTKRERRTERAETRSRSPRRKQASPSPSKE